MSLVMKGYVSYVCHWLKKTTSIHISNKQPNSSLYNVGIDTSMFESEYLNDDVFNICYNLKNHNKVINENQYMGTILNYRLEMMHFMTPLKGKIIRYNHMLLYRELGVIDLSDTGNWLYTIEVKDED